MPLRGDGQMAKRSETITTTLRIPKWLWKQLEAEAKKKDVSLNSEMTNRLDRSFKFDRELFEKKARELVLSSNEAYDKALKHEANALFILEQIRKLLEERTK